MATGARVPVVLCITELGLGGTPRRLQALAERLDRARFAPHVLSVMPGGPIAQALRGAGVPVETLGVHSKLDLLGIIRLLGYLRHVRAQILHAFNFHANLLAKFVGKFLARVPVVVVSEASVESAKAYGRVALDRWTARWVDAHYANAEAVRKTLVERERVPADRIWMVPTGVDTKAFGPQIPDGALRAALGIGPAEPVVVSVGRLDKYKGQAILLEACARDRQAGYRLVLVGDGPARGALAAKAEALGIRARVIFAGARDEVGPFLSLADCVALASTEEGMPASLLEAMAMGRPVVATAVGGIPEAIRHGKEGYLVAPGDAGALAEAIAAVLGDPQRARAAMGRAARERVEREFTVEAMVCRTEAMYEALLAGRGGKGAAGRAA